MTNAIVTMQLITVTNSVACRRTFLKKQATQSVSKSWHCIRILFKISILLEAIASATVSAAIIKAPGRILMVLVQNTSLFVHKTSPFVQNTSLLFTTQIHSSQHKSIRS
ncbi:MAG: hypothetical protein RMZ42_16100 [Nostoc sp. DedQUE05]|uniref:hypothetical protein n=1 Tax=Nostoc sp. DedQUE05 TaxID=3075391 RepID=UPI002AD42927|nr:hypothetical protein [Nostoc sp. DedQUE05]MDZ8093437.1 hypothetical protein [Nostoc sp. DedQUE05]